MRNNRKERIGRKKEERERVLTLADKSNESTPKCGKRMCKWYVTTQLKAKKTDIERKLWKE